MPRYPLRIRTPVNLPSRTSCPVCDFPPDYQARIRRVYWSSFGSSTHERRGRHNEPLRWPKRPEKVRLLAAAIGVSKGVLDRHMRRHEMVDADEELEDSIRAMKAMEGRLLQIADEAYEDAENLRTIDSETKTRFDPAALAEPGTPVPIAMLHTLKRDPRILAVAATKSASFVASVRGRMALSIKEAASRQSNANAAALPTDLGDRFLLELAGDVQASGESAKIHS